MGVKRQKKDLRGDESVAEWSHNRNQMNLKNKRNVYQASLGKTFDATPKAVLGAVVASLLSSGGERLQDTESGLQKEWWILYRAGIVPQKPPMPEPE